MCTYVKLDINLCTYRLLHNHMTHAYLQMKCKQNCKTNTIQINIVNVVKQLPFSAETKL